MKSVSNTRETNIENQPGSAKKKLEKVFNADYENCPVRHVLDRFGDKWSILVISLLSCSGKMRFNELSREIGDISQKMLTVTLRSLEADGLIQREYYAEIPPRVEYELTKMGNTLVPLIQHLATWASEHMDVILKNRAQYKKANAIN